MNVTPDDGPFQEERLRNVRPLRPIRLLLAGREVRYLRAMSFLFERRGYATEISFLHDSLTADVGTFRPDVVLLAEDGSFGDAVARAMEVISVNERLTVVVATSRAPAPDSSRLRFVPRWGPFAELEAVIERAWADLPSLASVQSA